MNKIAHFIVHSKVATLVAALLCTGLWVTTFITGGNGDSTSASPILQALIAYVIYATLGAFLMRVNERTTFNIPGKTTLTGTLFFIGSALIPQIGTNTTSIIHLALLSLASYVLLSSYRQHDAMGHYLLAFSLVGIASLVTPAMLFIAPLLLICCILLQSLHLRTILAAIFGLLLPYWVALCALFVTDTPLPTAAFVNALTNPAVQSAHTSFSVYDYTLSSKLLQLSWLLLLIIPGIMATFFSHSALKARTQSSLYFLTTATLLMTAIIIVVPGLYTAFMPLLFLATSISAAAFFITDSHQGAKIYLITLMVVWILIAALSVWNNF